MEINSFIEELKKLGFINEEKYNRLTGRNSFTDEQKAGFIARQLVETSQGTKGVANILQQLLPESKIVYAKASNVSEFRQSRDIPKSRLVNEFHHAHDAYLNIVVGNVYYVKFTQDPLKFIKKIRLIIIIICLKCLIGMLNVKAKWHGLLKRKMEMLEQ